MRLRQLDRRVPQKVRRALGRSSDRLLDRYRRTSAPAFASDVTLERRLGGLDAEALRRCLQSRAVPLQTLSDLYLAHRFDLLGSGWVQVRHGTCCAGVEGNRYSMGGAVTPDREGAWLAGRVAYPNLPAAQRTWQLVDTGYVPIDWQLDFKSGWRWSERTWYQDIRHGDAPGADVKVPWELARMQHLPQLALAASGAVAGEAGFAAPETYAREFRNEILDFIATNQPRYGVNWHEPMDVAIRAVNWLIAYDLFRAGGSTFDAAFESVLCRSTLDHGRHIAARMRWDGAIHGNHYLADLVGLLFVSVYLPRTSETNGWLEFAAGEFYREAGRQFLPDGGNIEASTSYHRLSGELVTYGVALLQGTAGYVPQTQQLDWVPKLLCGIAKFCIDVTKPTGHVAQVGDNDNGQLLKLIPSISTRSAHDRRLPLQSLIGQEARLHDTTDIYEDHLDHRSLVAAINGILSTPRFAEFAEEHILESTVVSALAGGQRLGPWGVAAVERSQAIRVGGSGDVSMLMQRIGAFSGSHRRTVRIELPPGATTDARYIAYPDFGLYIIRSDRLFVAVRCGGMGGRVLTGHSHNDQLAVELSVDDEDWIRDPGAYLYTASAERRNAYRSWMAHFVPRTEGPEPGDLREPFALPGAGQARCLAWGPEGFAGEWRLSTNVRLLRAVQLHESCLSIVDGAEGRALAGPTDGISNWRSLLPVATFAPGYGSLDRE